jgi:hypothetical protein
MLGEVDEPLERVARRVHQHDVLERALGSQRLPVRNARRAQMHRLPRELGRVRRRCTVEHVADARAVEPIRRRQSGRPLGVERRAARPRLIEPGRLAFPEAGAPRFVMRDR